MQLNVKPDGKLAFVLEADNDREAELIHELRIGPTISNSMSELTSLIIAEALYQVQEIIAKKRNDTWQKVFTLIKEQEGVNIPDGDNKFTFNPHNNEITITAQATSEEDAE